MRFKDKNVNEDSNRLVWAKRCSFSKFIESAKKVFSEKQTVRSDFCLRLETLVSRRETVKYGRKEIEACKRMLNKQFSYPLSLFLVAPAFILLHCNTDFLSSLQQNSASIDNLFSNQQFVAINIQVKLVSTNHAQICQSKT